MRDVAMLDIQIREAFENGVESKREMSRFFFISLLLLLLLLSLSSLVVRRRRGPRRLLCL